MTDASLTSTPGLWQRLDKVWLLVLAILLALLVLDPPAVWPTVTGALRAFGSTLPFILIAVGAIGYLKATGAEAMLTRAFQGNTARMVIVAALAGGLSPFCSCEVIPFIAALLAAGTPLSAVMAFWLASPLMDPAMFAITAGGISTEFAIAKTIAAVALGLFGGFATMALAQTALFTDPLRPVEKQGCGCGPSPFKGTPVWRFWSEPARVDSFRTAAWSNLIFLGKWLMLAYTLEMLMIRYIPAGLIADLLGGTGPAPVILGGLVGAPAYLNGYAAVPLVAGLLDQGMVPGAAMSFVIAGGVTSIPAAIAVWALVKPRVFFAYLCFASIGAIIAGLIWNLIA
ncbi:MAG: permease [Pseudomonadota bacterium]